MALFVKKQPFTQSSSNSQLIMLHDVSKTRASGGKLFAAPTIMSKLTAHNALLRLPIGQSYMTRQQLT